MKQEFELYAADALAPARVAAQHRGAYVVYAACGERPAEVAGRLRHDAASAGRSAGRRRLGCRRGRPGRRRRDHPRRPRAATGVLAQGRGGRGVEQVVAANVDVVFLVSAFGDDLNVRRIERYLASGWESGAQARGRAQQERPGRGSRRGAWPRSRPSPSACRCTSSAASKARASRSSSPTSAGNRTAALLGSSGVGKSSLLNRLLGWERQEIQGPARRRQGGVTRRRTASSSRSRTAGSSSTRPGCASSRSGTPEAGVDETFSDVADLAAACRFADCAHESEPGCAVRAALCGRHAPEERFESYASCSGELQHLELKTDARAMAEAARRRAGASRAR